MDNTVQHATARPDLGVHAAVRAFRPAATGPAGVMTGEGVRMSAQEVQQLLAQVQGLMSEPAPPAQPYKSQYAAADLLAQQIKDAAAGHPVSIGACSGLPHGCQGPTCTHMHAARSGSTSQAWHCAAGDGPAQ
jgi:hypothetical protein